MDYNDLMNFTEEDVGPMTCYVCGTIADMVAECYNHVTGQTHELPVCGGCVSALPFVLELEDRNHEANRLLAEGTEIVKDLQKRVSDLEDLTEGLCDETDALFTDNCALTDMLDDAFKRLEAGVGPDDVEFTVIASADYED